MRILLSGASGFIGKSLALFLSQQGHTVVPLIRAQNLPGVFWNPERKIAHPPDFEEFDAVIHLAAEPLTLRRWTPAKKQNILSSRTLSTHFLSHLFTKLAHPPTIFLVASAIGYYGDRGEERLTEESSCGQGFLSHVCSEWEKASEMAARQGIRTLTARFGLVLGAEGGVLKRLLPIYRWGLGGRLGSGQQWISWIALQDLIRALSYLLTHSTLRGAVNLTAPNPTRQVDFAFTLAHLLHRPSFFHLPAWWLRLIFGETADELLLASTYAVPTKLLASNFIFDYPSAQAALLAALN